MLCCCCCFFFWGGWLLITFWFSMYLQLWCKSLLNQIQEITFERFLDASFDWLCKVKNLPFVAGKNSLDTQCDHFLGNRLTFGEGCLEWKLFLPPYKSCLKRKKWFIRTKQKEDGRQRLRWNRQIDTTSKKFGLAGEMLRRTENALKPWIWSFVNFWMSKGWTF